MPLVDYGSWVVPSNWQERRDNTVDFPHFLEIVREDMFFRCWKCDRRSKGLDKLWDHEKSCKGKSVETFSTEQLVKKTMVRFA